VSPKTCPYSWQALALWLFRTALACLLAAGMLFGPEVADAAWDHGVHVTPAQAALHAALVARGITHHHGQPAKPVVRTPGLDDLPMLQAGNVSSDWGFGFGHLVSEEPPPWCTATVSCSAGPGSQQAQPSLLASPPSPPPEAA